jgi:hypothetical protein
MNNIPIPPIPAINTIDSSIAHYLVIGASIFGIAWGLFNVIQVSLHPDLKKFL